MLSKEEKLIRSLSAIKQVLSADLGVEYIRIEVELEDNLKESFNCIEEIEKHIVNYVNGSQPLKFEELHKDMWIWDKQYKSFLKVIGFYGFDIHVKSGVGIYEYDYYIKFEKNRFYARQIEE